MIQNSILSQTSFDQIVSLPSDGQENIAPSSAENTFGFGRQVCPGRITAATSLLLGITNALFSFNIGKPTREDGLVEPEISFTPDFISRPVHVKCSLTPRKEKRRGLILDFEREHPFPQATLINWLRL